MQSKLFPKKKKKKNAIIYIYIYFFLKKKNTKLICNLLDLQLVFYSMQMNSEIIGSMLKK
jgi:hypothetical protein